MEIIIIRHYIILFILFVLLTACSPAPAAPTSPILPPSPTSTQILSKTPISNSPENNSQAGFTETPEGQVILVTQEPPEIILTAINLQLEDKKSQLTQAADQLATMSAEIKILETTVASLPTTDPNSSESGGNQNYKIPSNVHTAVTVENASVFVPIDYNDQDKPVMWPYEPRIYIQPGTEIWVYKETVMADGGTPYWENYDPDGETEMKAYFHPAQIQIRLKTGQPNPEKYPENVAKAKFTENTVLFIAYDYDDQGKPALTSYQPIIRYEKGDYEIVYPEFVVATGGAHYYLVYDPDGEPSGYVPAKYVEFPNLWE